MSPHLRGEMTRMMKAGIEIFLRQTEIEPIILKCLKRTTIYQRLLIKSADIKVSEDRAEQERAEEAAAAEAAASLNLIEMSLLREVEEKEIADIQSLAEIAQEQEKADEAAAVTAAALKSTEKHRVKAQQKAVKRDIAQQKADEAAATTAAVLKSTEEHRMQSQVTDEQQVINAEKKVQVQRKAENKAADKAAAAQKADEEKAYAAYKVTKAKKKADDAADAARTAAKQAAGVERKKAEYRFDAELRAASAAPERQRKSTFCGQFRRRRPKVIPKVVESWNGFVLSDDQFCVKLKTVAINQTEFQRLEQVRQQGLRELHPIEVKRSAYRNSSESALTLINSMLSLIESYVDMPLNSSLKGCYKELCVKAIDLFRTYIGNDKIGFTALIQKQSSYQFLESQRLAMDRVSDCENYPQGAEGVMGDTRYGVKIATDADKNEDPPRSTRITKGAEGKGMGMERKRLKTEKKIHRKMKRIKRSRQAWDQKLRDDSKQVRITKPIGKAERAPIPPQPRMRTRRGPYQSPKRAKSKVIQRTRMKGYGKKRIKKVLKRNWASVLHTKRRLFIPYKQNSKRLIRKGSTDVYLLKRTIELEID